MKFFMGKLSRCLMFTTLKQCHYTKLVYIHGKTFPVLLKMQKFSPANLSSFTVAPSRLRCKIAMYSLKQSLVSAIRSAKIKQPPPFTVVYGHC